MRNSNFNDERRTLSYVEPALRDIYDAYKILEDQKDAPDAGIELADGRKIGIEITSVDSEIAKKYFNDEKAGVSVRNRDAMKVASGGDYGKILLKKCWLSSLTITSRQKFLRRKKNTSSTPAENGMR